MKMIKKRAKRKPKSDSSPPENRYYFTADTQAAIVEFQSEPDIAKKKELYTSRIQPAFVALADNLIRINHYEGLFKSRDELKHDCVTFLYETLGKFDNARGSAAFSYFNVVAKNWLTVSSRTRAARSKKVVSIDTDPSRDAVKNMLNQRLTPSPDDVSDTPDLRKILRSLQEQCHDFSDAEHKCFYAILQICDDPEIVADAKRTHIMAALKGLTGQGRDFSSGISRLRERYKALRKADV